MAYYLAERYLPAQSSPALASEADRLRWAARDTIELMWTLYAAEDEICFHLFDAASAEEVLRTAHAAGVAVERVVNVVGVRAPQAGLMLGHAE